MDINEILKLSPDEIVKQLRQKTIVVPGWETDLKKEYESSEHPVTNKRKYPDIVNEDGSIEEVTRITSDLIKLAVKRTTELCFGVPVKRVKNEGNDRQKEIATYLENIYKRCRIDSFNIERGNMLFSGCEVMTLWYAVEEPNNIYGFPSPIKLRCKNFSPTKGDELYPYFDEYGDMVALSVQYTRKVVDKNITFFDAYFADRHLKMQQGENNGWETIEDEPISLGKIPAVYMYRPTPVWENTAPLVYEIEWSLSRNGNYLRKNAKPILELCADEEREYGKEKKPENEFRTIIQLPRGSSLRYVTWSQAIESLKYHILELRQMFFSQLQLPDWSYENMKSTPMSGEARKQLFMDAHLKVKDESGRLVEFLDRETNIIKSFLKIMLPVQYSADIDMLQVENKITPYTINDWTDKVSSIVTACGGEAIMSVPEGIQELGLSTDTAKTQQEIREQKRMNATEMEI